MLLEYRMHACGGNVRLIYMLAWPIRSRQRATAGLEERPTSPQVYSISRAAWGKDSILPDLTIVHWTTIAAENVLSVPSMLPLIVAPTTRAPLCPL